MYCVCCFFIFSTRLLLYYFIYVYMQWIYSLRVLYCATWSYDHKTNKHYYKELDKHKKYVADVTYLQFLIQICYLFTS